MLNATVPQVSADPRFREAFDRCAAIRTRLGKFPEQVPELMRYLAKRDSSWDELFRACAYLERHIDNLEAERTAAQDAP